MRLIDADALTLDVMGLTIVSPEVMNYANAVAVAIADAPTIEAEPVRHGKWIAVKVDATETKFQCSECGREVKCGNDYFMKPTKHINASYPYCHCGAKMDLE